MESKPIAVEAVLAALQARLGDTTDSASLQQALQAVGVQFSAANVAPEPSARLSSPISNTSTLSPLLSPLYGSGLDLLRYLINCLPVAASWFDADLNMLACNQLYQQMLDFPDELFAEGQATYERFIRFNAERGEYGEGDPAQVTAEIVARAKTREAHVIERVRPNGTVLEIRGTPMPEGGFLSLYSDITAHKRAEQAALRSETYLRAVIAQLPQGLTVIDENLDIVLWNRLWETNCGARPGFLYDGVTFEAAVRHLAEMGEYGGGDAQAIDEQVAMRVKLAKQFQPHCFRRERASGQVIEIEGRPMSIEGKIAGFITMYNDVTDRLAIDDLKAAKEAAEAANRLKSEFLALISHEIRTPLAGVIGMLKFALRDSLLQAETRQLIERGQDSAQSLLAIINDLLDFSKIEAGKLHLEVIDFALADVLRDVFAMFSAQAMAKEISFSLKLDPALPAFVQADPVRLRQVLINLIGNAFKFTQEGEVALHVQLLGQLDGSNRLRFAVQDSGIGIAPDAVGRIFEKFEQADTSTTRRFGGTGLGLSICRQLVELMQGQIGVNSELGRGSEFYFVVDVPTGQEVQQDSAKFEALQPHSHQLRVLCADDFATNQIIVRMLVEEMGHLVSVVDSGEAALAAVSREHFDVILMDGRMPGMDGPTASRLIRAGGTPEHPVLDENIYIIAVTANASEDDRKFYLHAGMDDFLPKPIDEHLLHQQLSNVIGRQLQRGIALPERVFATVSELDAMFGVDAPVAAAGSQNSPSNPSSPSKEQAAPKPMKHAENEMLSSLRASFLQDIAEKLDLLDVALAARHADDCGRLVHSVRGSVVYIQDTHDIQNLCLLLEPEADAGNWALLESKLPILKALIQQIPQ